MISWKVFKDSRNCSWRRRLIGFLLAHMMLVIDFAQLLVLPRCSNHSADQAVDAPRIEPPMWVQVMARRVEAQIQRDWHFGFVSWNYLFKSAINLSRTLYSYEHVSTEDGKNS